MTLQELNDLLRSYSRFLTCWKVGLYYGSTVYFELGERLEKKHIDGDLVEIGSSTLVLYGYKWRILHKQTELMNSSAITRDEAETTLAMKFKGLTLSEIEFSQKRKICHIHFGEEYRISIADNAAENEKSDNHFDDLFTLFLPNGQVVGCRYQAEFVLDVSVSNEAREHWRKFHLS